jgi:hypothetical protein
MLNQLTRGRRPVKRKRNNRWLAIQIERLEPLQLLTPLAGSISPHQISVAYGFNDVAFDGYTKVITRQGLKFVPYSIPGTGAGQTIAIIEIGIDPHIESDTNVFSKQYGLPTLNASNFTEYKAPGSTKDGSADPTGFAQETSIDVEWAHAIAPQAKILLVDEGSETNPLTSGLIDGVNYAANQPGVSVVSYSYGNSEFAGETLEDQYFTTPAGHTPVAFVAASGDSVPETPPNITTNWPAMSPEVLSVGGTYFTPNANGSLPANGAYANEAAWGEGPGQGASNASGGGISPFEPELLYTGASQLVPFVLGVGSSTRLNPDVSYNAEDYSVYDTDGGGWILGGGTSAGTPQWAALVAIADQGRALYGLPNLDNLPSRMLAIGIFDPGDFHDITSGGNPLDGYNATPFFDLVTGFGTPKAQDVVRDLVASPYQPAQPSYSTGNALLPQVPPTSSLPGAGGGSGASVAMDAGYPMRDTASAAAFITPVSHSTLSGGLFGSGSASAATAAAVAVPTVGYAPAGPITAENAANSSNSSLAISGQLAADRAESAWLNFADPQRQGGSTGDTHGDAVDAVSGNTAIQDAGNVQTDVLQGGTNPVVAALLTQAIDSCFEKSAWMADGDQLQVATGADGRDSQAAPALAVSVGIVSAWFVRRRRSKKAATNLLRPQAFRKGQPIQETECP